MSMEWAIVGATLLGPVLAVQVQKYLEALRARRGRKEWVVAQLMATRGSRLANEHVQALNMIDLAYFGVRVFGLWRWQSSAEKQVVRAWKEYHDNLNTGYELSEAQLEVHLTRRTDHFYSLLTAVAREGGYEFDLVDLRQRSYTPAAHENIEMEIREIRHALREMLSGKQSLRLDVTSFPSNPEGAASVQMVIERAVSALERIARAQTDGGITAPVAEREH